MKRLHVYAFLIGTLLVISVLFQAVSYTDLIELQAQSGKITLNDLRTDDVYALKGSWEYFADQLADEINDDTSTRFVQIEHFWEKGETGYAFGVASYRLTLSGLDPQKDYGIYIRDQASSYRLSVNGKTVVTNGMVSEIKAGYQPDMKVMTAIFRPDQQGKVVFIMEIANHDRWIGGFWSPVIIGSTSSIQSYYTNIVAVEIFLLATMLSLGLFFLLMSSIDSEKRSLYMSIFSLSVAFRILSTGMHFNQVLFPSLSFMMVVRMEYLSGYLLLPIAALLIDSFHFAQPIKGLKKILSGIVVSMILFTAFASDQYLEISFYWFEGLVVLFIIYLLWLLFNGLRNKVEGIKAVIIGILFLILGTILELFFPAIHFGLYLCSIMFVLLVAVSVMVRFAAISTRKESLETEVLTDHLTGVGNRASLFKELVAAKSITTDQQRYILFIDLNKFKSINDTYGHEVGDAVLVETARRLKRSTRSSDLIFRYGGDEFVILAEITVSFSIEKVIDRIRANFETPFSIRDLDLTITLAIGYELCDPTIKSPDELLKRSDLKMYENKRKMDQ